MTDKETVTLVGGQELVNVHPAAACDPDPCPIHRPSDHHMVGWPQRFRADRNLMERTCGHGVGHPDPDDRLCREDPVHGVHGCDKCCDPRGIVAHLWEVGAGWAPLLDELHDFLMQDSPGYRVDQIKEKFGGLRVYLTHVSPEAQGKIHEIEERSYRHCEWCGNTDQVTTGGRPWIRTLCDSCRNPPSLVV